MVVLEHGVEPWTFDDLLELPESPWRYEIIDGALLMTPPPGKRHERVVDLMRMALKAAVPDDYVVWGPLGVDIDPTYLIPDLLVITEEGSLRDDENAAPAELALVVEVVSPGSVSTDRILKPAKYAAVGIPNYWRVETRPTISVTTYTLPPGADVYSEVGTWTAGETARLTTPFDLTIPIADLERP